MYNKYRVGRKQNRAVLNEKGQTLFVVDKKFPGMAELICDLLNDSFQELEFESNSKEIRRKAAI